MAEETKPAELTHWKQLTNPDFIGAYSLKPGEERVVEIIKVVRRNVKSTNGKETECTVAELKDEKPFILNKTNCKTLTKIYGTPFIENWSGKKIIIFASTAKFQGEEVEALRIRPEIPALPILNEANPKWIGAVTALKDKSVTMEAIEKKFQISKPDKKKLLEAVTKA
jgi:hypothetical protein